MEEDDFDYAAAASWPESRWADFFRLHDPIIRAVCSWARWRFPPHAAEEVAQLVRTRLPSALPGYAGEAPVQHFIKKLCMHACIDRVRQDIRASRRRFDPADPDDTEWIERLPDERQLDPRQMLMQMEDRRHIRAVIDALDTTCREAILLFYQEGLRYQEMAARLGVATATVGSRLAKCRDKLKDMLTAA